MFGLCAKTVTTGDMWLLGRLKTCNAVPQGNRETELQVRLTSNHFHFTSCTWLVAAVLGSAGLDREGRLEEKLGPASATLGLCARLPRQHGNPAVGCGGGAWTDPACRAVIPGALGERRGRGEPRVSAQKSRGENQTRSSGCREESTNSKTSLTTDRIGWWTFQG